MHEAVVAYVQWLIGSKLNLTEIQFLWSLCLRNLVLWSFHNWKISFHLLKSNHNEIRFFTLPWRWVLQFIEKMNVEENDWKPYDHTQFWMLIQNILFFPPKQQKNMLEIWLSYSDTRSYIIVLGIFMSSQRFPLDVLYHLVELQKCYQFTSKLCRLLTVSKCKKLVLVKGKLSSIHT